MNLKLHLFNPEKIARVYLVLSLLFLAQLFLTPKLGYPQEIFSSLGISCIFFIFVNAIVPWFLLRDFWLLISSLGLLFALVIKGEAIGTYFSIGLFFWAGLNTILCWYLNREEYRRSSK